MVVPDDRKRLSAAEQIFPGQQRAFAGMTVRDYKYRTELPPYAPRSNPLDFNIAKASDSLSRPASSKTSSGTHAG